MTTSAMERYRPTRYPIADRLNSLTMGSDILLLHQLDTQVPLRTARDRSKLYKSRYKFVAQAFLGSEFYRNNCCHLYTPFPEKKAWPINTWSCLYKFGSPRLWLTHACFAAVHGKMGNLEDAEASVSELKSIFPDFEEDVLGWTKRCIGSSETIKLFLDGLRETGVAVPD